MKVTEQGTSERGRHVATPRTLIFVTSVNPVTGEPEVLLLRGAADKRLWANRYNGLGGHVEAGEDVLSAAKRELHEEAGLEADAWSLRGVINIDTGSDARGRRPGVLVFVFRATSDERSVCRTAEGTPKWIPLADIQAYPLVDDLCEIIPRTLARDPVFYAQYSPLADGTMAYRFSEVE